MPSEHDNHPRNGLHGASEARKPPPRAYFLFGRAVVHSTRRLLGAGQEHRRPGCIAVRPNLPKRENFAPGGGWDYNSVLHLEPCGFGSLIRLRSQTAPGLQFSRYRRLAGYFNHTPMYQATALRSESRKNTRPHSVRDCRRYSRLICGSTRVRIPPRRVAKKETISDHRTCAGTAVGLFHAFSVE